MSDVICVTNRNLCTDDFLLRLERIVAAKPRSILLREKDLSAAAYRDLAVEVLAICRKYDVPCVLHSFVDVAMELHAEAIHMPLELLRQMTEEQKRCFSVIGASCHSVADALEAEALDCGYIIAGHVFATDCKKGLPGRGLYFLKAVCEATALPVYAIGGMESSVYPAVKAAGAKGCCVMSGLMRCDDAAMFLGNFERAGGCHEI